jgi:Arc/MetJ-type ribon-helix-helix transcriptional regulator
VPKKRTHIVIPSALAEAIDELVGKRRRSSFLTEAARREVRRLQQLRALENACGAWKDEDHPELAGGAAAWVEKMRQEDEEASQRRRGR